MCNVADIFVHGHMWNACIPMFLVTLFMAVPYVRYIYGHGCHISECKVFGKCGIYVAFEGIFVACTYGCSVVNEFVVSFTYM